MRRNALVPNLKDQFYLILCGFLYIRQWNDFCSGLETLKSLYFPSATCRGITLKDVKKRHIKGLKTSGLYDPFSWRTCCCRPKGYVHLLCIVFGQDPVVSHFLSHGRLVFSLLQKLEANRVTGGRNVGSNMWITLFQSISNQMMRFSLPTPDQNDCPTWFMWTQ